MMGRAGGRPNIMPTLKEKKENYYENKFILHIIPLFFVLYFLAFPCLCDNYAPQYDTGFVQFISHYETPGGTDS